MKLTLTAERDHENSSSQKTSEAHKTETSAQIAEKFRETGKHGDLKKENTFNAHLGEITFDIPIFSEEFLNYNRSKVLLLKTSLLNKQMSINMAC